MTALRLAIFILGPNFAEWEAELNANVDAVTAHAEDAAGNVVDTRAVTIKAGETYLYAPAHSKQVCWTFQTDGYGDVQVDAPLVPLDPGESFWQLPSSPDFWFQDTPDSVKTSKKSKGSKKSAVRQHACGDEAFAP